VPGREGACELPGTVGPLSNMKKRLKASCSRFNVITELQVGVYDKGDQQGEDSAPEIKEEG